MGEYPSLQQQMKKHDSRTIPHTMPAFPTKNNIKEIADVLPMMNFHKT
jgi:hypothetical protein